MKVSSPSKIITFQNDSKTLETRLKLIKNYYPKLNPCFSSGKLTLRTNVENHEMDSTSHRYRSLDRDVMKDHEDDLLYSNRLCDNGV